MTGRHKLRLATGPQLWTLNKYGLLAVVENAAPIRSENVKDLIGEVKASRLADLPPERFATHAEQEHTEDG